MKGKSWVVAILATVFIFIVIFYSVSTYHQSQMKEFGKEYNLELIASERMNWNKGPFPLGKSLGVYRTVYHFKEGKESVFWFMFEGMETYVYEEVSSKNYQRVNFHPKEEALDK